MKRAWRARRSVEERPDALSRWDRAHQLLLEWAAARAPDESDFPAPRLLQEACHENCIYVRVSTVTHSQQHTIEEQINRLRACLLSRALVQIA